MKRTYTNIGLVLGAVVAFCLGCADIDPDSLGQEVTWIKHYGSTDEEDVVDMIMTPDGDLLVLAWTKATGGGDDEDILLISLDAAGNSNWQRTYGVTGASDMPSGLALSSDLERVWIISTTNFGDIQNEMIHILNVNLNNGNKNGENTFRHYAEGDVNTEPAFQGPKSTRGIDIMEWVDPDTGQDCILVLGSVKTSPNGPTSVNNDPYSVYLSAFFIDNNWEGDEGTNYDELDTTYAAPWSPTVIGTEEIEDGVQVLQQEHGVQIDSIADQYYLMYHVGDENTTSSLVIGEIDMASGNPTSSYEQYEEVGENVEPKSFALSGQNIVVTGSYGSGDFQRPFTLVENRNNIDGSSQFQVIADPENGETLTPRDDGGFGNDIVRMPNGDFYIVGTVNNHTNDEGTLKQEEILLLRVGSLGDLIDGGMRVMGSDQDDNGRSIVLTPEGRLLVGCQVGFGGDATMVSVMKLNGRAEFAE